MGRAIVLRFAARHLDRNGLSRIGLASTSYAIFKASGQQFKAEKGRRIRVHIIVRQHGTKFHPGPGVRRAVDDTLFAVVEGKIQFKHGRKDRVVVPAVAEILRLRLTGCAEGRMDRRRLVGAKLAAILPTGAGATGCTLSSEPVGRLDLSVSWPDEFRLVSKPAGHDVTEKYLGGVTEHGFRPNPDVFKKT